MPDKKGPNRDVAVNRRAYHDYFIDEKYEAGLVLQGTEVKSLRAGRANLRDGYVRVDGGEAWLENVHITPYERGGYVNHEPLRSRSDQVEPPIVIEVEKLSGHGGEGADLLAAQEVPCAVVVVQRAAGE